MKKWLWYSIIMTLICACILPLGICAVEKNTNANVITSGNYSYFVNANGNTISITKYSGTETEVTIPETIDGYKVTIIGEGAFESNENITSVVMPDTVINVNASAFSGCTNLKLIDLSENVTVLGASAFAHCSSLETIDIPEKITALAENVFYNCTSLNKIVIPGNVTSMANGIFAGCYLLETAGALGTDSDIEFEWTDSIPAYAFESAEIEEIIIPDGITEIGKRAFGWCANLTKVKIPASVTSMGNNIFNYTPNLKTAGSIGSDCNIEFGWIEFIPSNAFAGASSLILVYIPKTITSIGSSAFSGCESLSNIVIPTSVEDIGSNAFSGCVGLNTAGPLSDQANGIEYNIQYEWTDKIADGAFAGNDYLESIVIPEGIESIGDEAFSGCSSLKDIIIPESVTSIGENAFYNCSSLTVVIIPVKVTFVGYRAFASCENLEFAYFYGDVPNSFESQVFYDVADKFSIYYPANNTSGWTTPKWKGYPAEPFTVECSEHKYTEVVVDPTCTSAGFTKKVCSYCGDSYIVEGSEKSALGHEYSIEVEKVEPTCGEQGYTVYECKNDCGKTETRDYVDALGNHDFSIFVKTYEPTCESQGYTRYKCAYGCGNYENRDYVEATGKHEFEFYRTYAPTCEEPGYTVYRCTGCGERENRDYVDALGNHDFSVFIKTYEPTCGEQGYTRYKCSKCDTYENRDYVDATGKHDFSIFVKTYAPTCNKQGYTKYLCANGCGKTENRDLVEATGNHDFSEFVRTYEPTCDEQGYSLYRCSACSENEKRDFVEATGLHELNQYTSKATCLRSGEIVNECENCRYFEIVEELPALGHNYVETSVVEPTCTEAGFSNMTCSRCNEVTVDKIISASHKFGNWTITKDATTSAKGEMQRKCSVCSEVEKAETPCLPESGHTHSLDEAITAADCTREGYTTYSCSCGYTYRDNYTSAKGHSFGSWIITKESTVTENGVMERKCSVCGETEYEYLPLLPEIIEVEVSTGKHEHSYSREVIRPTCEEEGYTIFTCDCGDSYEDNYKDERGHDFGDWKVVKEPTASKDGKEERICDVCGAEESRKIDALGEDEIIEETENVKESKTDISSDISNWSNPFIDISEYDSNYDAIHFVYENNLFKGVSSNRFAPDTNMNRAMFVTVVGRFAEVDTAIYLSESSFNDVLANQWYTPYVSWASEYGIVNGYNDTTFGIADDITVEQAIVMLSRYAAYMGLETYAYGYLYNYNDADNVSSWAENAVVWAIDNGIYTCDSMINPKEKASRALVAQMLYNFSDLVK